MALERLRQKRTTPKKRTSAMVKSKNEPHSSIKYPLPEEGLYIPEPEHSELYGKKPTPSSKGIPKEERPPPRTLPGSDKSTSQNFPMNTLSAYSPIKRQHHKHLPPHIRNTEGHPRSSCKHRGLGIEQARSQNSHCLWGIAWGNSALGIKKGLR